MAYWSRNEQGCFSVLFALGLLGAAIEHFGAWYVLGALGLLALWIWASGERRKRKAIEQERLASEQPCVHGVVGATRDSKRCTRCVALEEEHRRAVEQERAAVEARRTEAKRVQLEEWRAKARMPGYLRSIEPRAFEALVCALFRSMGYEVEETPYTGDSGVDGYLRLAGRLALLQCKRVQGSVGEPVLRDLFGSMHSASADEGIVVTTGKVSRQARAWARGKPIRIIELPELTDLVREYLDEATVVPAWFLGPDTHDLDQSICPSCGGRLRTVKGRRGRFVGCSAYPRCRYTRELPRRRR